MAETRSMLDLAGSTARNTTDILDRMQGSGAQKDKEVERKREL